MIAVLSILLVLSGISALTHQVVWVRMLAVSMGSTSASVSTVLTAFFLGMAIGGIIGERLVKRRRELVTYAWLELGIAGTSLVLLPILTGLTGWVAALPVLGTSLWAKFAAAMVLLSGPTICMGATFPVVSSFVIRSDREIGRRIGTIYAVNTAGAVLGAALSGFLFIPAVGLRGAIFIAIAANAIAGVGALAAARRFGAGSTGSGDETGAETTEADEPEAGSDGAWQALLVLFTTGLVSIAVEVGWTKYLAIFTGTTIYGFSAILATFLVGITAGSWWIRDRAERIDRPLTALCLGLIGLAAALFASRTGLSTVPIVALWIESAELGEAVRFPVTYGFLFVLLFAPTFMFGALFPISLRVYTGSVARVRARLGRAYAVNTIAGIGGSFLAGFVIIPAVGTNGLLLAGGLFVALCALILTGSLEDHGLRRRAAVATLIVAVAGSMAPGLDYSALIDAANRRTSGKILEGFEPEFIFLEEGKAGVISVVSYDGASAALQSNGLTESHLHRGNPEHTSVVEGLLGWLPYFVHEEPDSAFIVGFGGGNTTFALTRTFHLGSIRVVELEPAVVRGVQAFHGENLPALNDPRVTLEINDARSRLTIDPTKYDIIASQPSHPWIAGAGNLFTRDFFTLVQSRLEQGGVFTQWLNLFNMDKTTMLSILRAFYEVFDHGFVAADLRSGDILILGSGDPVALDPARIRERLSHPELARAARGVRIERPSDVLSYFCLSREQALDLSRGVRPNDDMSLVSEVRLGRLGRSDAPAEGPTEFLLANMRFDVGGVVPAEGRAELLERAAAALKARGRDIEASGALRAAGR